MSISPTYRIKWKSVALGDHAYLKVSYEGNTDIRIIPRAKGVKIWSTAELGGGFLKILVHAFIVKSSRYLLEKYFLDLDTLLELGTKGSLTIIAEDSSTITLTNCYLESVSQEDSDYKHAAFTLNFIKSL